MGYLSEFRGNTRPIVAATIGMSFGLGLLAYTTAIFAPHLINAFGWSKSQFALAGIVSILAIVFMIAAGRFTDLLGVKAVAGFGATLFPLGFLGYSLMDGNFATFLALIVFQQIGGAATSSLVYTKVAAERFTSARGLALTIITCGPAVLGAAGGPLLSGFIDTYGWRNGYRLMAVVSAVMSWSAVLMIPAPPSDVVLARRSVKRRGPSLRERFGSLIRTPAFLLIIFGVILCNLPSIIHSSQFKLLLLDNGLTSAAASMMISLYATGTIMGRLACGVALDKLPSHLVAAISMGAPAIGSVILATSFDAGWAIGISVLLMGLSQGAEGDVVAYLVAKYFNLEMYGTVFGFVSAGISGTSALGALLLSITLAITDSFDLFLVITGMTILGGAACFWLLGGKRVAGSKEPKEAIAAE